jgi:hypothetical protein
MAITLILLSNPAQHKLIQLIDLKIVLKNAGLKAAKPIPNDSPKLRQIHPLKTVLKPTPKNLLIHGLAG